MLNLHFGDLPEALLTGDGWFNNQMDFGCITTDFGRRVIASVDKAAVFSKNVLLKGDESFPPKRLARGTKYLMILMYTDKVVDLAAMGNNCFPFLREIADMKDIFMCTDSPRPLFRVGGFSEVKISNVNKIVHSDAELFDVFLDLRKEGVLE